MPGASLRARQAHDALRVNRGWRSFPAYQTVVGEMSTLIYVSYDKNGRQVRAEQDSKKARQVVEALLPALRDRIRLQRDEATVVVDGRALLRVRPVSASETSVLEFVPAALQRLGLDRAVVEAAFLARAGRRSFRTEEWI